jgi:hypothetical protein
MRLRKTWHIVSAIVGAATGASLVLVVGGVSSGRRTEPVSPTPPAPDYEVTEPAMRGDARLLLAWSPMGSGGLPVDAERQIERLPAVSDATTVQAGLVWMQRSVAADGVVVDDPPSGMGIPMEVAIIEPGEYARFVAPGEREAFARLTEGDAVIPETEAAMRGSRAGLELQLGGMELTVTDVVSDIGTNGYEVMMAPPAPPEMKVVERFLLIHLKRPNARPSVVRELRGLLTSGQVLRVRAQGETPFLRYGDAVAPGLLVKKNFGEFAARPLPDGTIDIEPTWENVNILTGRVPVLGEVTCHRALFAQLRRAMREIRERGLGFLVNRSQYGGCFGPRFISRDPRGRLSHHSWGIAIDVNVAENPFGTRADQDPRLVEAMERAGFTWGGRWLVPDGMHFEWARFP